MTDEHHGLITERQSDTGMTVAWNRFAGPSSDSFGRFPTNLGDVVLAMAYKEDGRFVVCGSGFMVAKGLLITAAHVSHEELAERPAVGCALLPGGHMRIWGLNGRTAAGREIVPVMFTEPIRHERHDVSLCSCELRSEPHANEPIDLATIDIAMPAIGERLWGLGFRRTNERGERDADMVLLGTTGRVIAQHPDGLPGFPCACVYVEMQSLAGMSGGPVFNTRGNVVGLIAKSMEGENAPTLIALVWSVFAQNVPATTWPDDHWPAEMPSGLSTLNYAKQLGRVRVNGHVYINPEGLLDITGYDPRLTSG